MTGPLRIGSLFSGVGGLDLAALEVFEGSEVVWHCEFDEAPAKVLDYHWPGVPNYRDVTAVDWTSVPPIDILTGGFPCQDVSLAGRRAGLAEGTRSGLWSHMSEAVRVLRPRFVLIENVRGLLSASAVVGGVESGAGGVGDGAGGVVLRALGAVLGSLADLGYDARWTSVRASDVGAPHHRERVFILASPADAFNGQPYEQEGTGGPADERSESWGSELWAGGRSDRAEDVADADRERCGEGTQQSVPGAQEESADQCGVGAFSDPEGVGRDSFGLPVGAGTQRSVDRVDSGDDLGVDWGVYGPAVKRWERVTRPAPAPTELNRNGRPRLNPEFASWMMGWPAGWVTDPKIGLTRSQQLKAIGNGVVPQQCVAAVRDMLSWDAGVSP